MFILRSHEISARILFGDTCLDLYQCKCLTRRLDSVLDSVGDPVFGYRMSDQPSNAIWGNPTAGLYDSASKGFSSIVSAVRSDNDFTQADARNVAKVFPWGNWLMVRWLTGSVGAFRCWSV